MGHKGNKHSSLYKIKLANVRVEEAKKLFHSYIHTEATQSKFHKPHKSFSNAHAPAVYLNMYLCSPTASFLHCLSLPIKNLSLSGYRPQSQMKLETCSSLRPALSTAVEAPSSLQHCAWPILILAPSHLSGHSSNVISSKMHL